MYILCCRGLFIIYLFNVIGQRIACCLYGFEHKFIEATRNVIIKAETRKYVDDSHTKITGVMCWRGKDLPTRMQGVYVLDF